MTTLKRYNSATAQWETLVTGPSGFPVPAGGSTRSVLTKNSGTDRDASWGDANFAGHDSAALNTAGAHFNGSTGLVLTGLANNWAQTPDSAALSITGDMEIVCKFTPTIEEATFWHPILIKFATGFSDIDYSFYVGNAGNTGMFFSRRTASGGVTYQTSASTGFSANNTHWVKAELDVDNGAGLSVVRFYRSTNGVSYTQIGSDLTSANTSPTVDGASFMRIGFGLSSDYFRGTLHRLTIRNGIGGTIAFDANFETVPANAMAFTESSSNAAIVGLTTSRYQFGVPCTQSGTVTTNTTGANTDSYGMFFVHKRILVDILQFTVTTAPASSSNVFCAVYSADGNFQPTGAPVISTGPTVVSTTGTGDYYISVTPTVLEPGAYLTAINTSVSMTLRTLRAGINSMTPLGNTVSIEFIRATRTNAAFTNPGTPWVMTGQNTLGPAQHVFMRWREV